jgi:hypothetical protein
MKVRLLSPTRWFNAALLSDNRGSDYVPLGDHFASVLHRALHETASGLKDNKPKKADEECKSLERHGGFLEMGSIQRWRMAG